MTDFDTPTPWTIDRDRPWIARDANGDQILRGLKTPLDEETSVDAEAAIALAVKAVNAAAG